MQAYRFVEWKYISFDIWITCPVLLDQLDDKTVFLINEIPGLRMKQSWGPLLFIMETLSR